MNNFLITGCAGFIGSHTVDTFLSHGHNVVGVDKMTYASNIDNINRHNQNPNFRFFKTDIINAEEVVKITKDNHIHCIVNFAAETHVDNSIFGHNCFIDSNILGTKTLLELNIPICHISTDEVYGPIKFGSFKETDPLNPKNFYSATKAAAEHIVQAYANTFKVPYLIVRMSNNYGPRQHQEKFIPTIIQAIKEHRKIPIYGDGKNVRDWIYVKDSAQIIYNIVKEGINNQVYNISLKDEKPNIDVVKAVLSNFNLSFIESVKFVPDRLGHDIRYSITNDKVKPFINFQPTSFKDGVVQTVSHYMES